MAQKRACSNKTRCCFPQSSTTPTAPTHPNKQTDYLRRAAADGDVATINAILKKGRTSADPKKKEHTSALQMACRHGHLEAAQALVAKGADVNRVGDGL